MRITILTLVGLASSAIAIPHHRRPHPHPVRRDVDVVTTSVIETQMAVLYVDQNGNPVSTTVEAEDALPTDPTDPTVNAADGGRPWSSPNSVGGYGEPWAMPTSSSQVYSPEPSSTPPPQTTEAPLPSSYSPSDTSSASPPQSASPAGDADDGEIIGYTIAYAPYNADGTCKSESQINADVRDLKKYGMVRIYGTDCNQVPWIMAAAETNDMKVFAGIFDVNNAAAEAQLLIDGAKGSWSRIHSVSVGNEALSDGTSLDTLMGAISTARTMLQEAGYAGPITTVEVYSKLWEDQYKPLCDAIDYVAANCHPYFNAGETPENAGNFVRKEANDLRTKFCDKDVVITESGWPTDGRANGLAVPGVENQRIAIKALSKEYSSDKQALVLFSAYDDPWKTDNEYGVEHYWGIHGTAPSAR